MDKVADILLLVQVVHERWFRHVVRAFLLFIVLVAFVLGAFTAFMVIDKVVWGF